MTSLRWIAAVALLVLLAGTAVVSPASAASSVIGSPDIGVSVADDRVDPNARNVVNLSLTNDGDLDRGGPAQYEARVQTARNLRVRVPESGLPGNAEVATGEVAVGTLPSGVTPDPIPVVLELGDLEPGRYRIPVELSYEYTASVEYGTQQPEYNDLTRTVRREFTVVVEDRARFSVATAPRERPIVAGDTGVVNVTLRNTGTRTARDIEMGLTSRNPGIYFGGPENPQGSTALFASAVEPGATRRFAVQVGAGGDLAAGEYPVGVEVGFEDRRGVAQRSLPLSFGVAVAPEHDLDVALEGERIRVGEDDGVIAGTVTNEGGSPIRNAVLRLSASPPLSVTGPESAVGTLRPGETADVRFDVAVPDSATPGRRDVRIQATYDNARGQTRQLPDAIRRTIDVGPQQDDFVVESVETSLAPGGSATLDVVLRNAGGVAVSDANAKLFVNDPLSSSDDETFLGEMSPNETATATFTVSAADSASPKDYAASLQLRFDDGDGQTEFSDDVDLGVPVSPADGGPPVAVLVVLAVAAGAAVYYLRFR